MATSTKKLALCPTCHKVVAHNDEHVRNRRERTPAGAVPHYVCKCGWKGSKPLWERLRWVNVGSGNVSRWVSSALIDRG